MTALSRRDFLKRTGAAAVLGLNAPARSNARTDAAGSPPVLARAFTLTPVYTRPDPASAVSGRLLPDAVTPIVETLTVETLAAGQPGTWYRIAQPAGYVPSEAAQPIQPYMRPVVAERIGDGLWAEVVAPYSAVLRWCGGAAPIVARLGFGAVVYVVDRLTDDHWQVWYGLADAPGSSLLGWSPALQYAPWQPEPEPHEAPSALVLRQGQVLVYAGRRLTAQFGYYGPALSPAPAATTISAVQPGSALNSAIPLGLSWLMRLESGPRVYGAFWHNRTGAQREHGADIELSTLAARWLYVRLAHSPQPVPLMVE